MKQLEKALKELEISCDGFVLQKYEKYMEEILKWNEKVNLTSITEPSQFLSLIHIFQPVCAYLICRLTHPSAHR